VRSDPEAWPWGPLGLLESLRDTEVLQHKILTCLPVVIGLAEGLYGYGLIQGRPRTWLLSTLALFGGTYLFLHFHGGRLHLDWIYAQHVAMGLVGLGVGVGLLLTRRAGPGSRLHFVWPAFLFAMSLVLMFYSEQ
jgi:putative copper resistance protein D